MMLMSRKGRASTNYVNCHDVCDSNLAPTNVVRLRRMLKRRDRQAWKKENF